jgi:hypothetical protein
LRTGAGAPQTFPQAHKRKGEQMIELGTEIRWVNRRFEVPMERIMLSEQLGYDAVFTAEGYGSDGLTPLGYVAGHT